MEADDLSFSFCEHLLVRREQMVFRKRTRGTRMPQDNLESARIQI